GANSGNPVSATALSNCSTTTTSGSTLTITGAGACTVTATQAGNSNYNAAQSDSQTFGIAKAQASVTLGSLSATYNGTAHYATASTTPSGLAVVLSYAQNASAVAAPTNAGSYDVTATIDDANYQGSTTGTLVIAKASQTITFPVIP